MYSGTPFIFGKFILEMEFYIYDVGKLFSHFEMCQANSKMTKHCLINLTFFRIIVKNQYNFRLGKWKIVHAV